MLENKLDHKVIVGRKTYFGKGDTIPLALDLYFKTGDEVYVDETGTFAVGAQESYNPIVKLKKLNTKSVPKQISSAVNDLIGKSYSAFTDNTNYIFVGKDKVCVYLRQNN